MGGELFTAITQHRFSESEVLPGPPHPFSV